MASATATNNTEITAGGCVRCGGLQVMDYHYSLYGWCSCACFIRCVNCGNVTNIRYKDSDYTD